MVECPGEKDKLTLQYAAENRRSEIALLWSRSLYFWGFITVLLTAFGASFGNGHKTLAFMAACFGFLASLAWTLANRSSKYWQTVWERKTEAIEGSVLSAEIFTRLSNPKVEERWFWGAKEYSPSKLAIALSDLSVAGWAVLVLGTGLARLVQGWATGLIILIVLAHIFAVAFTGCAALALLIWCRSGDPHSLQQAWSAIRHQATKIRIPRSAP